MTQPGARGGEKGKTQEHGGWKDGELRTDRLTRTPAIRLLLADRERAPERHREGATGEDAVRRKRITGSNRCTSK